jgi:hypothetical protein
MTAWRMAVGLLIVLAPSVYAADGSKAPDPALQRRLTTLAARLEAGHVQRVEIVRIPESLITDTAIAPAELESVPFYRLTVPQEGMSRIRGSLAQAVRSVVPRRREKDGSGDFRWAIIFYGPKNMKEEAIYFGRLGHPAELLGGTPAFLEGNLLAWMRACFGPQLR